MAKAEVKTAAESIHTTTGEITGGLSTVKGGVLATNDDLDFSQDAGMGQEGMGQADFSIPFVAILQGLSPQIMEGTVPDAKVGDICDSVSNELWGKSHAGKESIFFVPCAYTRRFIAWAPRSKGGGFKGEHLVIDVESGKVPSEERPDEKGVVRLFSGENQLKDTRAHYGLLLDPAEGTFRPAVISMSSTQIKKSKRWNAMIAAVQQRNAAGQLYTPPSFARVYELSTVKEQNDQGIWYGWSIGAAGPVKSRELYDAAKAFHRMVVEGKVTVAHQDDDAVVGATGGDDASGGSF